MTKGVGVSFLTSNGKALHQLRHRIMGQRLILFHMHPCPRAEYLIASDG